MEQITSLRNPKVIFWKSLRDRKARDAAGVFFVEGVRMVREALESSFPVEAVLVREDFSPLPEEIKKTPVYSMPEHVFNSICETKAPQGIAAIVRRRVLPPVGKRLLALDGVQDPGNVGTMIRTADAAGFDGLLLSPDCADPFSPKVLRSSMGSIFRMGISIPSSLPEALDELKSRGWSVLSSQLDGEPFYERKNVAPSFVLIIGNEGNGVSPAVQATATHRLRLPMRGGAESLNAAVAAGIMMYELMKDSSPD